MSTPIKKPIPTRHYFDSIDQEIVPYPTVHNPTKEELKQAHITETATKDFFKKEFDKWKDK